MAHRLGRLAMVAAAALAFAPAARGQGCILCYTSTAAGGPTVIHALHVGILSLLIPVVVLFLGIVLLVLRRARRESTSA